MKTFSVSAICPIRDEQHSIVYVFDNLKQLGTSTEVIFVEGGSKDNSWNVAKKYHGKKNKYGVVFRLVKQKGKGKAEAVASGFNEAQGKYLIIVDADLSVAHSELLKVLSLFHKYGDSILASGNRLNGFKKPKAFYWINYLGNYFFRYYYSLILNDKVLDISCGTKAVTKDSWKKIRSLRAKGQKLDTWGDIDWLYYGKKSGLSIRFADIRYLERLRDESKLQSLTTRYAFAFNVFLIGLKILFLR
jgi:glycosyltransferase involved in cell wall biosynthesis